MFVVNKSISKPRLNEYVISTRVRLLNSALMYLFSVCTLHTANFNLAGDNSAFRECNGIVLSFVRHNDSLIVCINRQSRVEHSTAPGAL